MSDPAKDYVSPWEQAIEQLHHDIDEPWPWRLRVRMWFAIAIEAVALRIGRITFPRKW